MKPKDHQSKHEPCGCHHSNHHTQESHHPECHHDDHTTNTSEPIDQTATSADHVDHQQALIQDYEHQLQLAHDKICELQLEVMGLKQEILKGQDEYKSRLAQKAQEANAQVAAKRQELEDRLTQEIEVKKHKLISNDMQQLFATIDQFENVINTPNSDPQVNAYIAGFKMLLSLFEQSLTNLGISRIMVKPGDKFDADTMAAIDGVTNAEFPVGCVVKVQSPAYIYNDKVVKHAIVIVSK